MRGGVSALGGKACDGAYHEEHLAGHPREEETPDPRPYGERAGREVCGGGWREETGHLVHLIVVLFFPVPSFSIFDLLSRFSHA